MSLFPEEDVNAHYFARSDSSETLGTYSDHGFELEDQYWPTVEHYFQASKFEPNSDHRERIRLAPSPEKARKLGRTRWKAKVRNDWKKVREVIMTRGVYTKCRTHPDIAQQLLDTGDQRLVENSQYDYFWGCGRDRRGENTYGKVLMKVRAKLLAEQKEAESEGSSE